MSKKNLDGPDNTIRFADIQRAALTEVEEKAIQLMHEEPKMMTALYDALIRRTGKK